MLCDVLTASTQPSATAIPSAPLLSLYSSSTFPRKLHRTSFSSGYIYLCSEHTRYGQFPLSLQERGISLDEFLRLSPSNFGGKSLISPRHHHHHRHPDYALAWKHRFCHDVLQKGSSYIIVSRVVGGCTGRERRGKNSHRHLER